MNTIYLRTGTMAPAYLFPSSIGRLIDRKQPSPILRDFRNFVDSRPNYFNPLTPIVGDGPNSWQYDPICVMFFFEHRNILMDGNRTLKFKDHFEEAKAKYHAYTITQETMDEMAGLDERLRVIEETLAERETQQAVITWM